MQILQNQYSLLYKFSGHDNEIKIMNKESIIDTLLFIESSLRSDSDSSRVSSHEITSPSNTAYLVGKFLWGEGWLWQCRTWQIMYCRESGFDNANLHNSRTAGNLYILQSEPSLTIARTACWSRRRDKVDVLKKKMIFVMFINRRDKMHLLFWSCSRSRGKMGPSLGHSRCRKWGSPCRRSRCLRIYSCAYLHNVPSPWGPLCANSAVFRDIF